MLSREQELIQTLFAPLAAKAEGAAGLRDDAAVYRPAAGCEVVMTTDTLVESVHFLPGDPAGLVARKALRVNLSDLAAKGATPRGYLLSVSLTGEQDETWLKAFADGLAADQETYGCVLLGGDTVATPGPFTVTVAAFGDVPEGRAVRRGGARHGDLVYVSGTLGDAGLGLAALRGEDLGPLGEAGRTSLIGRYRLPVPCVELAPSVLAHASAAIDISDGLVGDLGLLCWASGCGARIAVADVPLSESARRIVSHDSKWQETCLTNGDDYEILCSVPPDRVAAFEADAREAGVPVVRIGEMTREEDGARFLDERGNPLDFASASYSHMR
ncbi:thiamine-phosphate kinase [Kaustia mangrovi]|uniref:Thiamine-monophosphate kinase n=1 Tax=Kaustia mangrovi TaxID=2593653 RepID=A0A7S8HDQ9_9HYPH|nr:thiamine-phosphate kinase [Kaustia mangrovi]QPC44911.1 thiamine-phosphate kinase [Kaustia mangrovi]